MKDIPKIYFYVAKLKHVPIEAISFSAPVIYKTYFNVTDAEFCHTIQTFIELKKRNFPCELTHVMPSDGIVVTHPDSISFNFKPGKKLLLVLLKSDKPPYMFPQINIVPNILSEKKWTCGLYKNYYIPHWLQPGLIPRDSARGKFFKNIAYIGGQGNLAAGLKSRYFEKRLKELGLSWRIVPRKKWHDFSDIDAIVAVRTFKSTFRYILNKTPQKLFNAWAAGVPAILGKERSYQEERRGPLDYIEVKTLEETIEAIKTLQNNEKLRCSMIKNGNSRVQEYSCEAISSKWIVFLLDVAVPAYRQWCRMSCSERNLWYSLRFLMWKQNMFFKKIFKIKYVDSSYETERKG